MIVMTVQTSYVRPEDDPLNWFTQEGLVGVEGPAVVTAISLSSWVLEQDDARWPFSPSSLLLSKLFIVQGATLRGPKGSMVSGYYIPDSER